MVLPVLSADGPTATGADSTTMLLGSGTGIGGGNGRQLITPTAPPSFYNQTTVSTPMPVIPSPYIDFIVVNGDDRYMIRCDRKAVLENSVELAKLIHAGPNSGRRRDNHYQILNVDKHDFELVIRFLEKKFVPYTDHMHILRILELAGTYNCPDLIKYCIRELDLQLTIVTVIDIFRALWFYQSVMPHSNPRQLGTIITTQASGKKSKHKAQATNSNPISNPNPNSNSDETKTTTNNPNNASNNQPNPQPFTVDDHGVALLYNVLQLIDMKAEGVLVRPEMCDLRFEELEMIVKRDALQLFSELVLFTCLADWSVAECKRKKLDCTDENRRCVLGPLCYAPRYLLMKPMEYQKACDRVELLDPVENALVRDAIDGKKLKNLTPEQSQLLEKFRTPRPEFAKMPIHLSDRSNPKNYSKKMRQAEKLEEEGCLYKFGMNCLTVFLCIFD